MSFYIILPSNAGKELDDKQSDFTVYLKNSIKLNTAYEVALVEISYKNLIHFELGEIELIDKINQKLYTLKVLAIEGELLSDFFDRIYLSVLKIIPPVEIKRTENEKIISTIINPIQFSIKKFTDDYISYSVEFFTKFKISFKGALLQNFLNLIELNSDKISDKEIIENKLNYMGPHSHFKIGEYELTEEILLIKKPDIRINFVDSIFLYSNIINPQYIGDSYTKVLRSIHNVVRRNEYVNINYENPHYVDVSKTELTEININMKDHLGNDIQFIDTFSRVVAKLHFRPKYNGL